MRKQEMSLNRDKTGLVRSCKYNRLDTRSTILILNFSAINDNVALRLLTQMVTPRLQNGCRPRLKHII